MDGQGNLERTWKVREKSGNLKINGYGRQSSENLFILFKVGWLVVLGLTALSDNISVYIGPSSKEREKEERKDR